MPRKVTVSLQRRVNPDRKYQSVLVQRLINKSMLDGKIPLSVKDAYYYEEAAYGKLIPVLVKAIQDLQAEVEALKSK